MSISLVPFNRKYIRKEFSCGHPSLDNYILRNATKDVKEGASACFVIIDSREKVVAYYTLTNSSIPKKEVPGDIQKKINYDDIPVTLLGRLAVDSGQQGKGLGKILIANALKRCLDVSKKHVGSSAVIVDPIDSIAENFYSKYGFIKLPDSGRMFMTMRQIERAFDSASGPASQRPPG